MGQTRRSVFMLLLLLLLVKCSPLLREREVQSENNTTKLRLGSTRGSVGDISVLEQYDSMRRRLTEACFDLDNYCGSDTCVPNYLDPTGLICDASYGIPAKCIDFATCSGGFYTCNTGYAPTWTNPGADSCPSCDGGDNLHTCVLIPTSAPSSRPSGVPSGRPSGVPSGQPTIRPTSVPSHQPTSDPTSRPSAQPTCQPSIPTGQPSSQPSMQPSAQPTSKPSSQPSKAPTGKPSGQPTTHPSSQPSGQPTTQPSTMPSGQPTSEPTNPTSVPSSIPTSNPTEVPNLSTVMNLIPWEPILITLSVVFFCSCGYMLYGYFRKNTFSLSRSLAEMLGWHDKVHEARERKKQLHLSKRRVAPLPQMEEARKFKHSRTGSGGGVVKMKRIPLSKKVSIARAAESAESAASPTTKEYAGASSSFNSPRSSVSTPRASGRGVASGRRVVSYSFSSPDQELDEESKTDMIRPAEAASLSPSPTISARSAAASSTTAPVAGASSGATLFSGRRVVNKIRPEEIHELY